MPRLQDFQAENDLSDDGVAALLTEQTGTLVTAQKVARTKARGDRRIPKSWVAALGLPPYIDPNEPAGDPDGFRDGDDMPPEPPASAPRQPAARERTVELDIDWVTAKQALVAIHVSMGMVIAKLRNDPELAGIFQKAAPILADDWIMLAKVDERARRIVKTLTVGGPAGKLATDYLLLIYAVMTRKRPHGGAEIPSAENFITFDTNGRAEGAGDPVAGARAASKK